MITNHSFLSVSEMIAKVSELDSDCGGLLKDLHDLYLSPIANTNPFNLNNFDLYMKDHPDYAINIELVAHGYPLHLKNRDTTKLCKTVRNIVKDKRELKGILKRMVKEAAQGFISGTDKAMHYTLNLLCVPKKDAKTNLMTLIRVARHGSYSTRSTVSINDNIDPEASKIDSLPNIRKYVEILEQYAYVSLRDLRDAFRQLGLAKADCDYIQYVLFGMNFRDNRQAYGVASAAANCQHFAELLIWICEHNFLTPEQTNRILVHIDDFLIAAHSQTECQIMTNKFDQMCDDLSVAVSHEKDENWIQKGVVHGFGFDLTKNPKTVFIPDHKFIELVQALAWCIEHRYVTGEALESICGKLMHWAQFRRYAKVLCYRMLRFIHTYIRKRKHLKRSVFYLSDEIILDMRFWLKYAWYMREVTMASIIYEPSITLVASSDASGFGAGFVVGEHWAHYLFETKPNKYGITHSNMSINYQEAHAVIMFLHNYRHLLSGRSCLIFVDNTSVLWSIVKNWATSPKLMEYIHEIVLLLCIYRINLRVEHIPTQINSFSDALSRRELTRFHRMVEEMGFEMNEQPTPLQYYSHLTLIREGLR